MQTKEEIFEGWYVEKGFPEMPNADFASIKEAFIQGWAFGRAEGLADRPLPAPWKAPAPIPGDRPRYRVGKVSALDWRPVTEAQMKFVRKLINARFVTVWSTDYVFTVTKNHCKDLGQILTDILTYEGQTYSIRCMTMGQASQIIDLLKKKALIAELP